MGHNTAIDRRTGGSLKLVNAQGTSADSDRYEEGWRAGKPVEDPYKLKRWGFVTAKPSEYLVVVKRGRINRKVSGQLSF